MNPLLLMFRLKYDTEFATAFGFGVEKESMSYRLLYEEICDFRCGRILRKLSFQNIRGKNGVSVIFYLIPKFTFLPKTHPCFPAVYRYIRPTTDH